METHKTRAHCQQNSGKNLCTPNTHRQTYVQINELLACKRLHVKHLAQKLMQSTIKPITLIRAHWRDLSRKLKPINSSEWIKSI